MRFKVYFRSILGLFSALKKTFEQDGNGTIFAWRVNGVLLFIRGANIIPFDAFQTDARVGRQRYESTLGSAAAAHMSMVRGQSISTTT